MLENLKEKFHNMMTEKDNSTVCPVRVGFIVVGVLYHVASFFMVMEQKFQLDMATMGQYVNHMIQLLGAGAVSITAKAALKGDSDPA